MFSSESFPVKLSGMGFILCGIAYLLFWNLYALMLPFSEIQIHYSALVLHKNWLFVNMFQIIGAWAGMICISAYYFNEHKKLGITGFLAYIVIATSFLLMGGLAVGETFFWHVIAGINPEILNGKAILNNPDIQFISSLSFGAFAIGNLLFGLALVIYKRAKVWITILIGIGGLLYSIGYFLGDLRYLIQSVALMVLLLGGYIPFGISQLLKKPVQN